MPTWGAHDTPSTTWTPHGGVSTTWTARTDPSGTPNAYRFDGTNGDVYFNPDPLALGNSRVTVILWFVVRAFGSNFRDVLLFGQSPLGAAALRIGVGDDLGPAYPVPYIWQNFYHYIDTRILVDQWYKLSVVCDRTASGNANILKAYLSARDVHGGYPADVAQVIVFGGSGPTTTTVTAGPAILGMDGESSVDIEEVRIFTGAALTLAQVQAETLGASTTATHQYKMEDGATTDSGSGAVNLTTGTTVGTPQAVESL